MTAEDFIKTNLDAPTDYEVCEIHVTSFTQWDNIPSALYVQILCKTNNKVVHTVAQTKALYMDVRGTDAISKDIVTIMRIFTKIPLPKIGVEIYIHDLAGYLALTRQMHQYSNTLKEASQQARRVMRTSGLDVKVRLGTGDLKKEFYAFCVDENRRSATYVPTFEILGIPKRNSIENRKG